MKKNTVVYGIYVAVILAFTIYFSIQIIEGNFKDFVFNLPFQITGKYTLTGLPRLENENVSCPCKEICTGSSGCEVKFTRHSEDPLLHEELNPGVEQIFDGFGICVPSTTIKINSYGFRDYEYSINKPNNTFRIVILGDSFTFGLDVDLNEAYPKILEKLLNEKNDGRRYEVLNFGVPGYNAIEKVEVLKSKAIKFNPDLVIFQYLGDDVVNWTEVNQIWENEIKKYSEGVNKNTPTNFELESIRNSAYGTYLRTLQENKFEDVWKIVEDAFQELNFVTQNKSRVLLLNLLYAGPGFSRLKSISQTYNWIFINFEIDKYPPEKWQICPEERHPNPFFHKLVAERIYKELIENKLLP